MKLSGWSVVCSAAALLLPSPASAQEVPDEPGLAVAFANIVTDVCLPLVRGQVSLEKPSKATERLLLEPVASPPPFLTEAYGTTRAWFRPQQSRGSVFIGQKGDRPVCRVILANTKRTVEVQNGLDAVLRGSGFAPVVPNPPRPDQGFNDKMWASETPDGVVLVTLQGPRSTINGGTGDQGVVAVGRVPTAEFRAMQNGT